MLSKTEVQLKRELINNIEQGENYLETLQLELTRLRREHYNNL